MAARVAEALNTLGMMASPEALATLRTQWSDDELRAGLEKSIQTCLTLFAVATSTGNVDADAVKAILTDLLQSPDLLAFQDPATLSKRLQAVLMAMGVSDQNWK